MTLSTDFACLCFSSLATRDFFVLSSFVFRSACYYFVRPNLSIFILLALFRSALRSASSSASDITNFWIFDVLVLFELTIVRVSGEGVVIIVDGRL